MKKGIRWGLQFAAIYCAYAGALWLARGEAPFTGAETTLAQVIAAYLVGGFVGGAVFGLLEARVESFVSAAFVGFLTAIPVFIPISLAALPRERWFTPIHYFALAWSCLTLGPLCGISMFVLSSRQRPS